MSHPTQNPTDTGTSVLCECSPGHAVMRMVPRRLREAQEEKGPWLPSNPPQLQRKKAESSSPCKPGLLKGPKQDLTPGIKAAPVPCFSFSQLVGSETILKARGGSLNRLLGFTKATITAPFGHCVLSPLKFKFQISVMIQS